MSDAHRQTYLEEARDLLADLESSLLELEESPKDMEIVGRVFRDLHTIKGSGSMFGFDDIAAFTHEIETVFDLVRNEGMSVTKPLVDLTLAAGDHIRRLLARSGEDEASDVEGGGLEIIASLKELVPSEDGVTEEVELYEADAGDDSQCEEEYRITFRPHADIFMKGTNPILLLEELKSLGEATVVAHTDAIPHLPELNPEECHTYWDIILTTSRGIEAVKDVFIFVEDDCDLEIQTVRDFDGKDMKLGEILIERGLLSPPDLQETLGKQKPIGELLVDSGLVELNKIESGLAEQEHMREINRKRHAEESTSYVKVPAQRLDLLVDLVGELVTVQARLSQTAASQDSADLSLIAEEVERLTAELRDNTMGLRMMPIGTTFNRFKRLVRDLSNDLGKEISLTTDGAETELDKTVIERLNDPMVHLIRNSIDHGIEPPEVRQAAGKPTAGKVRLSAEHSGSNVLIRIEDDGAGLDREAIRSKAVEKGLIAADSELTDKEVFSLIFAPGFSTAKSVTSVSGRGVGMDVVKRNIEALRGSVEISSKKGAGTVITLKLPLTLAIIDGLLVKIGEGFYVLPLSIVEECIELTREDVKRSHGRHVTYVRGDIVPYVRLRDRFGVDGEPPAVEQIVITESQGGKMGLVVDKVIGEHQTVIKSMGSVYRSVDVISGATILGDGMVALIMDVPKLLQRAESRESLLH